MITKQNKSSIGYPGRGTQYRDGVRTRTVRWPASFQLVGRQQLAGQRQVRKQYKHEAQASESFTARSTCPRVGVPVLPRFDANVAPSRYCNRYKCHNASAGMANKQLTYTCTGVLLAYSHQRAASLA